jgi:hypothetical protein
MVVLAAADGGLFAPYLLYNDKHRKVLNILRPRHVSTIAAETMATLIEGWMYVRILAFDWNDL